MYIVSSLIAWFGFFTVMFFLVIHEEDQTLYQWFRFTTDKAFVVMLVCLVMAVFEAQDWYDRQTSNSRSKQ